MLFLAQLQQEGYSIYVVPGPLPHCAADDILRERPAVQTEPPRLIGESGGGQRATTATARGNGPRPTPTEGSSASTLAVADEEEALRAAMALSMRTLQPQGAAVGGGAARTEDEDLELALQMSRSMIPGNPTAGDPVLDQSHVTSEEDAIQQAIQASLASAAQEQQQQSPSKKKTWKERREEEQKKKAEEEDKLKKALAMSMGAVKKEPAAAVARPSWKRPSAASPETSEAAKVPTKPARETYPGRVNKTFSASGEQPPPAAGTISRGSLSSPFNPTAAPPPTSSTSARFGSTPSSAAVRAAPSSTATSGRVAGISSIRSSTPPESATSPSGAPIAPSTRFAAPSQASTATTTSAMPPPLSTAGRPSLRGYEQPSVAAGGRRLGSDSGQPRSLAEIRQSTPDPEEVRRKRMAFLDKMQQGKKE